MDDRLDVEVVILAPKPSEMDVLSVSKEPGCFVVSGVGPTLQAADSKDDR